MMSIFRVLQQMLTTLTEHIQINLKKILEPELNNLVYCRV